MFGAIGDGVTDDTKAIQAAIDALPATGGTVALGGAGDIFLTSSTINVNKPVRLVGHGFSLDSLTGVTRGATIIVKSAAMNAPALLVTGANCLLQAFKVDGKAGNGDNGIVVQATDCTVREVSVLRAGQDGIRIGRDTSGINANQCRLDHVLCYGNGRHGLFVDDATVPSNAALVVGTLVFCQANTGDGIRIARGINCFFFGGITEQNTGLGVRLASGAANIEMFGMDIAEVNNGGSSFAQLQIDSGAQDCNFIACLVDETVVTNNGTRIAFWFNRASNPTVGVGEQLRTSADLAFRRHRRTGTPLATTDFSLSAGWGATGAVNAVKGSDMAFTVDIIPGGAGIAANPTFTVTFKDGAWDAQPIMIANQEAVGGPPNGVACGCAPSGGGSTTATVTFYGTPVAGITYRIAVMSLGGT